MRSNQESILECLENRTAVLILTVMQIAIGFQDLLSCERYNQVYVSDASPEITPTRGVCELVLF
jgi:hypothetical protein